MKPTNQSRSNETRRCRRRNKTFACFFENILMAVARPSHYNILAEYIDIDNLNPPSIPLESRLKEAMRKDEEILRPIIKEQVKQMMLNLK